jgi:hypothetical protein
LEDKICLANITHLRKVQQGLDVIMDKLHSLELFHGEQWSEWQRTQREEEATINNFANNLGFESLEELCTNHEQYTAFQAENFASLVDKAAGVTEYMRKVTALELMPTGIETEGLVGIGFGFTGHTLGQKIVNGDGHILAYKALTRAMIACKRYNSSLQKLRNVAKQRWVPSAEK